MKPGARFKKKATKKKRIEDNKLKLEKERKERIMNVQKELATGLRDLRMEVFGE